MQSQQEEETFTGKLDFTLWRRFFVFAVPYRGLILALGCVAALVAVFDVVLPLVSKRIIDHVTAGGDAAGLWPTAVLLAAVFCCFAVAIFAFILLAGRITSRISHDLRQAAFAKLQQLSFSYYDRRAVGWLMARLTGDVGQISRVMGWALLDICWGVLAVTLVAVTMIVLNWQLGLIVLAISVPLFWVCGFFQRKMLFASRALRKANSITTGAYNEGITGVRTSKSLVREAQNTAEFGQLTQTMYGHAVRNLLWSAAFWPTILTMINLSVAIALWRGGHLVIDNAFTVGTLFAYINLALFLMFPAQELANTFTMIASAQASAERVLSLLDEPVEIEDKGHALRAMGQATDKSTAEPNESHRRSGDGAAGLVACGPGSRASSTASISCIEFRQVSFKYKDGPTVLTDFDLKVPAGQSVALVGPTGGGKSTIVNLACRFYEPTAGQVLINGIDYRELGLLWLQSRLGMVPQQPHLFNGTIRDNLRYGRLEATDADIEAAARLTRAHDFIVTLADGYNAKVGEGGNQLSTGQKQLIALARAILADPQIFVLDEATSSVDTHTEKAIQHAVEQAIHGRISFVIAHRLSTIKRCDRILVIGLGKILEQGSHHDLLEKRGRYYELYTNQFTAEHEEALLR